MLTLQNDWLAFRFPHLGEADSCYVSFKRIPRIPDTDKTYSVPLGFGEFPLRHVDDYASKLAASIVDRGGVIMPMWQSEALCIGFHGNDPVAIKVAAGKINAVTGEPWRAGLSDSPQDYMVSPEQTRLDGFAVEKGVIRQFVAMPLGEGYSAEEQLTDKAEWGGLQISVTPLTEKALANYWSRRLAFTPDLLMTEGLGVGGLISQAIYSDPFELEDWDIAATQRVFVSIIHGKDWAQITGESAPHEPLTAADYAETGLPWYEYYGADKTALEGSRKLGSLKSVARVYKAKTGSLLPASQDVEIGPVVKLGLNA